MNHLPTSILAVMLTTGATFACSGCSNSSDTSSNNTGGTGGSGGGSSSTTTGGARSDGGSNSIATALAFDASSYTSVNVTVDGASVSVRKYGPIRYVANPIQMATSQPTLMGSTQTLSDVYAMQSMYVYVPESSASSQTTAIWMMVNNAGWYLSPVSDVVTDGTAFTTTSGNDAAAIASALKEGYVVISVGTRGRGAKAADGTYAGKAPACIVDAKAAIRYLRLNDDVMPGSAERIVINGTSGGGALVTTVAASGNSSDYYSDLATIGAAGISVSGSSATSTLQDHVFAVTAYCPINNLTNADKAYEWQYSAIRSDSNSGSLNSVAYSAGPQPAASKAVADQFSGYVTGLGLEIEDGSALTTTNLPTLILAQLKAEIERQIAAGASVPNIGGSFTVTSSGFGPATSATHTNDWLTLSGTGTTATVASIDYAKFLAFVSTVRALKTVVAFDATGVTGNPSVSGESSLYGSASASYSNFSEWSWNNNEIVGDGSGKDDTGADWASYISSSQGSELAKQIKTSSPIPYLTDSGSDVAPYWYVRHGMIDRDTSFALQLVLFYAIKNQSAVKDVNFKLPYLKPHSGNYDAPEAFAWIKARLAAGD